MIGHRRQTCSLLLIIFISLVSCQDASSSTDTNNSETLSTSTSVAPSSGVTTMVSPNPTIDSDSDTTLNTLVADNVSLSTDASNTSSETSESETSVTPGDVNTSLEVNSDTGTNTVNSEEKNENKTLVDDHSDTNSTENPIIADGVNATTTSFSLLGGNVNLQTQVYIISGTFGIIAFLLIVLLLSLAFSVAKIKNQLLDTESRYIVDREERVRGYQNGGYHGGGDMIQHGGRERSVDPDTRDIAKMGYSVYSGNGRNQSSDNIPMQNVSRSQMMKFEEGVIPINSDQDDR